VPTPYEIDPLKEGEFVSVSQWEVLRSLGHCTTTPQDGWVDSLGTVLAPPIPKTAIELIRCCLAEDHPGRGIVFEVYPGTWSSATHSWTYSAEKEKAIDWWYSDTGPYPLAGATGIFVPRASDEYGTIYAAVSGDCDSPGSCPGV